MSADFAGLIAQSGLPFHEAVTLLAWALEVDPSALPVTEPPSELNKFYAAVAARREGVPVQYLTGTAHFRRVAVAVGPGVFIPRPETEVMTGWAIDWLLESGSASADGPAAVVELCAGSGAISLAIATEVPGCRQYAVEDDPAAFDYLRRNLADFPVELRLADLAHALPELDGQADLVIANPPYIPEADRALVAADVREHEPEHALFAGADGLDIIRSLIPVAARLLRPGGALAFEHAESNAEEASKLAAACGQFGEVRQHLDLAGRPRFTTAIRR
jgi:release factor glutamine methyltransferase